LTVKVNLIMDARSTMRYGLIGALLTISAGGLLADPGASLAVAAVLLFVLAAVVWVNSAGAAQTAGFARAAWQELLRAPRPVRQCDPDAAGQVRSRAPALLG
jgi:hypothetical protein